MQHCTYILYCNSSITGGKEKLLQYGYDCCV
jgi:hypothetical protein